MEASNDTEFRPDHALADGDVVSGDGWTLEAVTTPGHTANHMAFALREADLMFSGDHVMGWSTTIVAPPDGAMTDYMASLNKLTARRKAVYLPGHGGAIREAPRFVAGLDPAPQGARGLDPAPARQGRDRHRDHRARGLYRARSAAHRERRASRCWRTWRTWWRAARSRPKARPRSTAFIAWLVLEAFGSTFFAFFT